MSKLVFDGPAVFAHVRHAMTSDRRRPSHEELVSAFGEDGAFEPRPESELPNGAPALRFVKDDGIYIISNGPHEDRPPVAYARGYDPTTADPSVVWEKARAAVGGDDFVETFPITPELTEALSHGDCDVDISVTPTTLALKLTPRKLATRTLQEL